MILLLISFIAGVLTVLAPCVLPLLPVIVGGSLTTGSHRRAYAICISLGGSVLVFTLLLKASTAFINVPQSFWEILSGGILILFGVVMLFPRLWDAIPLVNRINRSSNALLGTGYQKNSIWGDFLMGAALGPVFASCSPTYFVILATVLPASFGMGLADLVAYVVGLSGFLLIIALVGQKLVDRLNVTIEPGGWFRRAIGVLFLIVGLAVATGSEAKAELWLLNHGFDVTVIEQSLLKSSEPPPARCTSTTCIGSSSAPTAQVPTSSDISLARKAALYPKAPELVSPDGYVNTSGKSITIGEFKGKKVVLIDIWTYSCINCQRTLPYIKDWYRKYSDKGLEIIGVHTPEFAFEKVQKNVEEAVARFGLKYPTVLDNEYKTWNAFGNQFWPRKYLIDIDGYIVYDHAGEGKYEETEMAIRAALLERAQRLGISFDTQMPLSQPDDAVGVEFQKIQSAETYFGSARNEYLANGKRGVSGVQELTMPSERKANLLYLSGTWDIQSEFARARSAGTISFLYNAKSVYLVGASEVPIKLRVLRDGVPVGASRGADVDTNGFVTVGENRLYKLVEDSDYGAHTLELQIQAPGLEAYAFTFG